MPSSRPSKTRIRGFGARWWRRWANSWATRLPAPPWPGCFVEATPACSWRRKPPRRWDERAPRSRWSCCPRSPGKPSFQDVLATRAIEGLGRSGDERALPFIRDAWRSGGGWSARRAVVSALAELTRARHTLVPAASWSRRGSPIAIFVFVASRPRRWPSRTSRCHSRHSKRVVRGARRSSPPTNDGRDPRSGSGHTPRRGGAPASRRGGAASRRDGPTA